MILRRVAVRHLKGIEAATYDDLSDRLNLFRGPNEAGKTTLVEALHFGLFEQSAGVAQHKRDLETWGRTEAPEVEIDLVDDDGEPWRVRKRFLHAPSTELHGRNAVYRGTDAERRLRAMLGTRPGNRHGVAATDLGIWPLLWVRQGEAGAAIKDVLTPDARDRLQQTLSTHTGAVAAGAAARHVRDTLTTAVDALRTPAGRPRGALADAIAAVETARLRHDDARDALDAARTRAARMRADRATLADLERRIAAQAGTLAAADAADRDAEALAAIVADARARLAAAEGRAADLVHARDRHDAAAHALDTAKIAADAARAALDACETRFAAAQRAEARQRIVRQSARDAVERARAVARDARAHAERDSLRDRLDALRARHDDASALEDRLRALRDEASRLPSPGDVEAIEAAAARLRDAEAARRPVRIALTGPDGATHHVDVLPGAAAEAAGWHVSVALPDGEDDPVARASRDLDTRLHGLGLPDLDALRRAAARRRALSDDAIRTQARLDGLAPEGPAALSREVDRLAADLARHATPCSDALPGVEEAEHDRVDAEASFDAVERAHDAAAATLHAARDARHDAEEAWRRAMADLAPLRATVDAGTPPDPHALDAVTAEIDALRAQIASHEARRVAHDHARGDGREETAALRHLIGRRDALRAGLRDDEVAHARARVAGPWTAWHAAREALAEAEATLAALRDRLDAQARALDAVRAAWAARQARLAGPVRARVLRDLPALFPGSEPALDDDGDLIGLRTGAVLETFGQLSAGSREQLGVLLRLAIARVLCGSRRLPVLLDDALVHSDPMRRQRLVTLLRRAADDVQILVFTSHEDDFDRLAADRIYEVRGRPARGGRRP